MKSCDGDVASPQGFLPSAGPTYWGALAFLWAASSLGVGTQLALSPLSEVARGFLAALGGGWWPQAPHGVSPAWWQWWHHGGRGCPALVLAAGCGGFCSGEG